MTVDRPKQAFWILFSVLFLALARMPLDQAVFFTLGCFLLYLPGAIAVAQFIERRLDAIEFHVLSFAIGTAFLSFAVFAFSHLLPIAPLTIFISEASILFMLFNIAGFRELMKRGADGKKGQT